MRLITMEDYCSYNRGCTLVTDSGSYLIMSMVSSFLGGSTASYYVASVLKPEQLVLAYKSKVDVEELYPVYADLWFTMDIDKHGEEMVEYYQKWAQSSS